jgi:enolase
MSRLSHLGAREVLDSRGRPTVEVEAWVESGAKGRAIVPSGASTGRHEAHELRDHDPNRFRGLGVSRAVENVRTTIADAVRGWDVLDQAGLDRRLNELDGAPRKSRLGANAILGVSLAAAHAAAAVLKKPLYAYLHNLFCMHMHDDDAGSSHRASLPMPMVNMISGGLHAGRQIDLQDILFVPVGARSYSQALEWTVEVYRALGDVLRGHGEEANLVGDEGGYGPRLASNERGLERLVQAFERAGLAPGKEAAIALDVAATHFLEAGAGRYALAGEGRELDAGGMVDLLESWCARYPIVSIEDGVAEDDWEAWQALTECLGDKVQLVGDDLFVTQAARLRQGIDRGVANAVLVKVNQAGTLTETFETMAVARKGGYRTVVSARSGETEDTTIADLAVGTAAGQIKIGSVARSERLAKYNQLLRIEEELAREDVLTFSVWPGR